MERYCGIDHRAISAWMAGSITPSPSPDKTRSVIKTPMWILAATGVSRDTTDDRSMQPPNNHLPPKRSAAKPPGTYKHTRRKLFDYSCTVKCLIIQRFIMSNSPLGRSGMTRVNEGSHSFACHPYVYPQLERTMPACLYYPPAERHRTLAGTHFPFS